MLTQLEQALTRCNGDKFAKICRQYLSYNYPTVMSPGFVLGKEKSRKGTPDIFIPVDDYYIFCEITTQSDRLEEKLQKDIQHCFNQTEIPQKKIIKIILICNSKVSPKLFENLTEYKNAIDKTVKLEIIDVDDFANRIFKDYHSIIRELGIPIDTNQIYEPEEFMKKYDKSGFSISLTNKFYNRTNELQDGLEFLNKADLLMLAGDAGVGKTKFALELGNIFKKDNPDYNVKIIASNGDLSIWDDLSTQLNPDKNYLLILDDANKLRANLALIINFINGSKSVRQIKIILPVRTYVKKEVDKYFHQYNLIELKKFSQSELKVILQSQEFNISEYYIDRIFSISKGNPRLAIMCAVAGLQNKDELENASEIYEKYFSSILNSVDGVFSDLDSLKVAGILSLFKSINFKNHEHITSIESDFGITKEKLLDVCIKLNNHEIADEYNEIYKISDQILGEYIFHKVFLEKKYLPFSTLLDMAYERKTISLIYTLTPIINNYGFTEVKNKILGDIKSKWNTIDCEVNALEFLKDFWFYIPTETLKYLKAYIDRLETGLYENYKFEIYKENHIASYDDEVIDILVKFKELPEKFDLAHELLLNYGLKSELLFGKYLKTYSQSFTYGLYSNERNYITQIQVIDFLYTQVAKNQEFFSKILLFIAPGFLKDSFETYKREDRSFEIGQRGIWLSENQKEFRLKLFEFIFTSFNYPKLRKIVYDCLQAYINQIGYHNSINAVINFDKKILTEFIKQKFKPSKYTDCFLVHLYVNKLQLFKLPFEKSFRTSFQERKYLVYLRLDDDRLKMKEYRGNYENYEKYKYNELRKFVKDYMFQDYVKLFADIQYIIVEDKRFVRDSPIIQSINTILEILALKDRELFLQCLKKIFRYRFSEKLELYRMFRKFNFDKDFSIRIRELLSADKIGFNYLMNFWFFLPKEFFIKKDMQLQQRFIKNNKFRTVWVIDKVFEKSIHLFRNIDLEMNKVIDLILNRIDGEIIHLDVNLFNFIYENYPSTFHSRFGDLQKIYVYGSKNHHFDFDLKLLRLLLSFELSFLNKYLESNFEKYPFYSRKDITNSYLYKLWKLDADHNEIFSIIIDYFKDGVLISLNHSTEITSIFKGQSEKEVSFLKYYLDSHDDERSIRLIYNLVLSLYKEKRYEFLEIILKKNNSLELFKKLNLYVEPSMTYSGSYIPRLKNAIKEIEDMKLYFEKKKNLDYLEHIEYLEQEIYWKNVDIERETKKEFLEEWGY